jgi:ABC-type cobalamin/Fe3+-siderophores transport system ATPase subunit
MSAIIGNTSDNHSLSVGDTERRSGLYILGKPGMGKTSLITNLIQQDIKNGHGVFFLDPTGNAINDLSSSPAVINAHKQGRIVILDQEHETRTFGINTISFINSGRIPGASGYSLSLKIHFTRSLRTKG